MSEFVDMTGATIGMADSNLIEKYRRNVDKLLCIIAPYMGWDDIDQVFVSDQSSLGDFQLKDASLLQIERQLGFPIKAQHLLYVIAAKMGGTEADA